MWVPRPAGGSRPLWCLKGHNGGGGDGGDDDDAHERLKIFLTAPENDKAHDFGALASPALLEAAGAHADYLEAFTALVHPSASGGGGADAAEAEVLLAARPIAVLARVAEMLHQIISSALQLGHQPVPNSRRPANSSARMQQKSGPAI